MKLDRSHSHAALCLSNMLALLVACHMGNAIAQAPAKKVPSGDPCTVVPLADVQKAFPGAKAGVRSTRVEKYGLTECEWKDGAAVVFGVQEFYGNSSALEEAKGMAMGFLDPSNQGAARNLRYETLSGVGLANDAVAIVEARDTKRGIMTDGAMLVLHRGPRTLFLTSPVLQARDRADALKTFEILGRIAAKRLD